MNLSLSDRVVAAAKQWSDPFFLEYVILGAWDKWKQRNRKHFEDIDISNDCWLAQLSVDLELLKSRVKKDRRHNIDSFVTRIVI
jgi:hypothetical protein